MNKNQWSLKAFTEKDISKQIMSIDEIAHSQEEFNMLLILKENHEKEFPSKPQQLLKKLNCKIKRRQDETSNLCSCCYQEMGSTKHWCKICGNSTCRRCLVRERELKDESKAMFCEKCDQEYLKAMDGITHFNKTEMLEQTLSRLIQEQESLQSLVVQQRQKYIINGDDPSQIAIKGTTIEKLHEENKILKVRNAELSKKVEFGKNISKDLRRKLKDLKKKHGESFGTVSNNESEEMMENRDSDFDMSFDHRESILTAATSEPMPEQDFRKKCTCDIY